MRSFVICLLLWLGYAAQIFTQTTVPYDPNSLAPITFIRSGDYTLEEVVSAINSYRVPVTRSEEEIDRIHSDLALVNEGLRAKESRYPSSISRAVLLNLMRQDRDWMSLYGQGIRLTLDLTSYYPYHVNLNRGNITVTETSVSSVVTGFHVVSEFRSFDVPIDATVPADYSSRLVNPEELQQIYAKDLLARTHLENMIAWADQQLFNRFTEEQKITLEADREYDINGILDMLGSGRAIYHGEDNFGDNPGDTTVISFQEFRSTRTEVGTAITGFSFVSEDVEIPATDSSILVDQPFMPGNAAVVSTDDSATSEVAPLYRQDYTVNYAVSVLETPAGEEMHVDIYRTFPEFFLSLSGVLLVNYGGSYHLF